LQGRVENSPLPDFKIDFVAEARLPRLGALYLAGVHPMGLV
jgi:hypothetical protein